MGRMSKYSHNQTNGKSDERHCKKELNNRRKVLCKININQTAGSVYASTISVTPLNE